MRRLSPRLLAARRSPHVDSSGGDGVGPARREGKMLGQVRGRAMEKDWRLAADARALRLARRLERRFGAMGAGKIERGARLNLDGRALVHARRVVAACRARQGTPVCIRVGGCRAACHSGMRPAATRQGHCPVDARDQKPGVGAPCRPSCWLTGSLTPSASRARACCVLGRRGVLPWQCAGASAPSATACTRCRRRRRSRGSRRLCARSARAASAAHARRVPQACLRGEFTAAASAPSSLRADGDAARGPQTRFSAATHRHSEVRKTLPWAPQRSWPERTASMSADQPESFSR